MRAFREAVEARDLDALAATLSENVVFRSPVAHKSYTGRDTTMMLLANVMQVFSNFTYVRTLGGEGDLDQALVFEANVGEKKVTGCDFIRLGEDGLIEELMVMLRPLSGLTALAEAMGARPEVREAGK